MRVNKLPAAEVERLLLLRRQHHIVHHHAVVKHRGGQALAIGGIDIETILHQRGVLIICLIRKLRHIAPGTGAQNSTHRLAVRLRKRPYIAAIGIQPDRLERRDGQPGRLQHLLHSLGTYRANGVAGRNCRTESKHNSSYQLLHIRMGV